MFKKIVSFMCFLLYLSASNVLAFDPAQYQHSVPITLDGPSGQFAKVQITPQIYSIAKPDLSDIRIVDNEITQIPYLRYKPEDIRARQEYSPTVINRSTDELNQSLVTLDFGSKVLKNAIEVETVGQNFRRPVKVQGSNNNTQFFSNAKVKYIVTRRSLERFKRL